MKNDIVYFVNAFGNSLDLLFGENAKNVRSDLQDANNITFPNPNKILLIRRDDHDRFKNPEQAIEKYMFGYYQKEDFRFSVCQNLYDGKIYLLNSCNLNEKDGFICSDINENKVAVKGTFVGYREAPKEGEQIEYKEGDKEEEFLDFKECYYSGTNVVESESTDYESTAQPSKENKEKKWKQKNANLKQQERIIIDQKIGQAQKKAIANLKDRVDCSIVVACRNFILYRNNADYTHGCLFLHINKDMEAVYEEAKYIIWFYSYIIFINTYRVW